MFYVITAEQALSGLLPAGAPTSVITVRLVGVDWQMTIFTKGNVFVHPIVQRCPIIALAALRHALFEDHVEFAQQKEEPARSIPDCLPETNQHFHLMSVLGEF